MTAFDRVAAVARAQRSLEGLSVGDAFGERFFGPTGDVVRRIIARQLPDPPWRYTDDTIMAISVVETLEHHGLIDQDDLALRFARKYARNPERGYGHMAHEVLSAICSGMHWDFVSRAAFEGQGSMGNGGAMRVAPVGAYFCGDVERVTREAKRSAAVTHAHPEGQAGAVAVAVFAALVAAGVREPHELFRIALERTPSGRTREGIARAAELALSSEVGRAAELLGTGQQVVSHDTVPYALWCAARHLDSFQEAMWTTVAGLGDRDTTCAIVGSIVALAEQADPVPPLWARYRERLEHMRDDDER
jgi:ADP-ribosylglycohydrolase